MNKSNRVHASHHSPDREGNGREGGVSWLSLLLSVVVVLPSSAAFAAEPAPAGKDAMPAVTLPATPSQPAASKSTSNAGGAAKDTTQSGAQPAKRAGADRLNLDTTVVTGNRELPKVLYIVPWKRSELGDLPTQPMNTLLDEALTPVDRDVFRREVTYYGAMSATDAASKGAPATPPAGSEK